MNSPPAAAAAAAPPVMLTPDAPAIIEHMNAPVAFTPFDVKWVPESARFVLLGTRPNDTGVVQVYELGAGEGRAPRLAATIDRPRGVKCGTFDASSLADRHLALGDMGGALHVIDLEQPATPVWSAPHAHSAIINAIDGCGGTMGGGAPEIATGSQDGCVRVWDTRGAGPVLSLLPTPGPSNRPSEVWAVAFGNSYNDEERCVAAGYQNGDVRLYDMRAGKVRWQGDAGGPGVVSLQFDRKDIEMNKLVATTLDSRFRVFDMRTQHPTRGFAHVSERAHKATVWTARHLPQARDIFVTTGGNGGVNVYKYVYPDRRAEQDADGGGAAHGVPGRLELLNAKLVSTQPLVAWDWCPSREGLAAAACLDQSVRVYLVTKLERHR